MKLLGKRVIFRITKDATAKQSSTIILAEEVENPYAFGEIVAVGTECGLEVGTTILINKHAANPIIWEGKELRIIEPDLIIAIQ